MIKAPELSNNYPDPADTGGLNRLSAVSSGCDENFVVPWQMTFFTVEITRSQQNYLSFQAKASGF